MKCITNLETVFWLHKKETAESSEIKVKLQRLARILELAKQESFIFDSSWLQHVSQFSIDDILLFISRLRPNKIGIHRIIRQVQPKSSRFQSHKIQIQPHHTKEQLPKIVINLNSIQSILGRLE